MSTDSSKLSCICNVTITRNMYLEDCEQLQGVSLLKHSKTLISFLLTILMIKYVLVTINGTTVNYVCTHKLLQT